MMHTFNACGEMITGWQDSLMLKLALKPVSDQSPIIRRLFAEDFTANVFMKSVGDRSAVYRRLFGDCSLTSRKPLQLVSDRNQSWLVFCACSKDWPRLIFYGDRSTTLLRPCYGLCKALPRPLQPLCDCHFYRSEVASSLGSGL